MFFLKKKRIEVYAPISGEVISIDKVQDPVFSNKMLGDGFAIIPKEVKATKEVTFIAPISGVLTTILDTGHAYGITEKSTKVECLIHIGMDTVELNGNGFSPKVQKEAKVIANNTPLVAVNLDTMKKNNKDLTTPVIFTKETIAEQGYKVKILKFGQVKAGDVVAELVKTPERQEIS